MATPMAASREVESVYREDGDRLWRALYAFAGNEDDRGRRRALPWALIVLLVLMGLVAGSVALLGSGVLGPARPAVWTPTGSMVEAHRIGHTATLLADGSVLVAGGGQNFSGRFDLASAELYDPQTRMWTSIAPMGDVRWGHTATLLPNGMVLVAGGERSGNGQDYLASAELYDPATETWSATDAMREPRTAHTATLLPDGKVLVAGGANSSGLLASAELYDPETGTWRAAGPMASPRAVHTATLLADGRVLVAGGGTTTGGVVASAELYDPGSGSWTDTGAMAEGRANQTATLLPDCRVLVVGGTFGGTSFMNALATAELYDPQSGAWSTAATMHIDRQYHTATLLPDGTVLVAGGIGSGGSTASAEVYEPGSDSWRVISDMDQVRAGHTATLLRDGSVLVASGIAEFYGPGT